MNRFLSAILVLVFLVSFVPVAAVSAPAVWDGSIGVGFAGGTGTETDPYLISNGNQLAYLAKAVNNGTRYDGKYIKLTNDIVLNDTSNWESWSDTVAPANSWTAIGGVSGGLAFSCFSGTFDGDSHTVSGIYINTGSNNQGLFGYILVGTVKDLGVTDSYIKCDKSSVGGVVGMVAGTVANCYNTGTISGERFVGGVAGDVSSGTVTNSYNTGTVTGTGSYPYVGGVVGMAGDAQTYLTVTNCYNTGMVTGTGPYVGGVAGYTYATVTNSYNTGAIMGNNNVGGITGDNGGTITNCCNTGAVTGTGSYVGGVAGYNIKTVMNSYNTGAVTGSEDNVGGVAGCVYYKSTVTNSYNTGAVTGLRDNVGGVVGNVAGTVTNCYNTGTISGERFVGGVAGDVVSGTVTNSYNTGTVSGSSSVGGVAGIVWGTLTGCYYLSGKAAGGIGGTDIPGQAQALSDTQMKQPGSFTGWDFASVWYFGNTGESYKYPMLIALRKDSFTFDPDSDLQINDDVGALTGVSAGTTAANVLSQFTDGDIEIYKDGIKLEPDDLVGTGCEIRLMDGGEILDSLTVVVKGDLDGDGKVNVPDARKALRAAVKLDTISDFQSLAADVDGSGKVEVPDARLILRVAVGLQGF